MEGTRVRALVREDPTCRGATKPMHHNCWSPRALEPMCSNYWAHGLQLLKPTCLEPVLCNKRSHHNEKPVHRNEESPLLAATRESLRAATKTQRSQKKTKTKTKKESESTVYISNPLLVGKSIQIQKYVCLEKLKFGEGKLDVFTG